MKTFFILLLLISSTVAWSQNPLSDPLRWSLGQGTDLRTSQTFSYSGTLTTSSQAVQWAQTSTSSSFSVSSVTGNWTDISQNGQLVFGITEDGASGLLTVERNSNGLFVTMEFPKDDPLGSKVRWVVTGVISNN